MSRVLEAERPPVPEVPAPRPRWSPARVAAGFALAAWASMFWILFLTGGTYRYLASRTAWVVPTGAVILTLAALGRLLTARTPEPERLTRRSAWGLGFVLIPVVTVLALPPSNLGSYAASRRSVKAAFVTGGIAAIKSGPVTFASLAAAGWSEDARRALVKKAGTSVTFEGIVTRREGEPADEFILTRFIITCCVADALSVQVRVAGAPPGEYEQDEWVRVRGTFYPVEHEMVVAASSIERIPRPDRPYVNV